MVSSVALIDGYTFFLTSEHGDPPAQGGLFQRDTRFLSELEVEFEDASLSAIGRDLESPARQVIHYADGFSQVNEISESGEDKQTATVLKRDQHISRSGHFTDELTLWNHSSDPVSEGLRINFGTDFADLFEVRGVNSEISRDITTIIGRNELTYEYEYEAADGVSVQYRTLLQFDPVPDSITSSEACYNISLDGQEATSVTVEVSTHVSDPARPDTMGRPPLSVPVIQSEQRDYAQMFETAAEDLESLTVMSPHGPVVLAGAPWFATMFGRDSLLTAYQVLPVAPQIAEGVLSYLAAHQADTVDSSRRAQPGKIFHEIRHGELARRGKIRYDPFYGTIDATALWIILLHETHQWTSDGEVVANLSPALDAALEWLVNAIDDVADDPFVYYHESDSGQPRHTAWKDSEMSVQFADGTRATPPLASAEVQGYTYDALVRAADLLRTELDDPVRADNLEERAVKIYNQFNEEFWLPERQFYAAALTDDGRCADTLTSNVGQCLWSGIIDPDRVDAVVERLFSDELYSGWGIRSMATSDRGYSPVSYHIGSVWPHDNSLIALGLAEYGYLERVERLASDLFDAICHWQDFRIPEVFCGFSDETNPVRYPASCEPQAWGAGTPYALTRAIVNASSAGSDPPEPLYQHFGLQTQNLDKFTKPNEN